MAVTNVAELNALVERVKKAQREYASFTQEQVDKIFRAAALAAALLAGAPRAAAVCPYTVGPLGRYIAPATVQGMTATNDGNAVEVWCTDALDGDDWFFTVDNKTELKIYSRVNLVIAANGTPDDYSDDKVIDALFCNDCTED